MAELGVNGFSWAKVLYSGVLVGVIVLLASELHRLWFDRTLKVGTFQFFENGEEKPALGRAFAIQVLNYHRTLSYLLQQEAGRRSGAPARANAGSSAAAQAAPLQENTWWPREVFPISDPKSALSDLELSVQGINIKQILTTLRQWVSTPNEIHGVVEKGGTVIRGAASWPRGPSRMRGDLVDGELIEITGQSDAAPAAFQVACGLVWAQAAARQQDLADVTQADFCDWAQTWTEFVSLRDKAARIDTLSTADVERVRQLHGFLGRLIARSPSYPEIFRLRADLIDLLPTPQKTDDDLAQAQDDRTTYTIRTDPDKRKLASDIVRFVVLAEARPAIAIQPDGALEMSDSWQSVLTPHVAAIAAAAKATGSLRLPREAHVGAKGIVASAFVVAPNIIATAGFVLPDKLRQGPFPLRLDDTFPVEFSFVDDPSSDSPGTTLRVQDVLYARKEFGPGSYFALLRLAEHDTTAHPPLKLQRTQEALEQSVGRYIFAVGYCGQDLKMPTPFVEQLLGGRFLVKRMVPGRVVSLGPIDMSETTKENMRAAPGVVRAIQSDISSAPGLSGGPLVDLRTGEVVGMHYAGRWQEGKGKFAYAFSMADMLALPDLPADVKEALGVVEFE